MGQTENRTDSCLLAVPNVVLGLLGFQLAFVTQTYQREINNLFDAGKATEKGESFHNGGHTGYLVYSDARRLAYPFLTIIKKNG